MALLTSKRQRQDHDYQTCSDEDCPRFPCRVYREGFAAGNAVGYGAGYGDGYGDGHSDGYGEGYAAGAASASG